MWNSIIRTNRETRNFGVYLINLLLKTPKQLDSAVTPTNQVNETIYRTFFNLITTFNFQIKNVTFVSTIETIAMAYCINVVVSGIINPCGFSI